MLFFPLFEKKDEATDPWGKIFLYPFFIGLQFTYILFPFLFRSESRTSGNVSNCLNTIQVLYCKTWPGGSRKEVTL